ncbi:Activating signal cointegrator 1, partial [Bonamia ostreae]
GRNNKKKTRKRGEKETERKYCNCQGTEHPAIINCTECGNIVCSIQKLGPCFFCGSIVTLEKTIPLNIEKEAENRVENPNFETDKTDKISLLIDDQGDFYSETENLENDIFKELETASEVSFFDKPIPTKQFLSEKYDNRANEVRANLNF